MGVGVGDCGRDVTEDLKPWKILYSNGIIFGTQECLKEHGLITIFVP